MSCPRIPNSTAKEVVERTRETGNEHALVVCGDGEVSDVVAGEESSLDVTEGIEACAPDAREDMVIFHTHPNGVKRLSRADKQVAGRDDVEAVCVADPDGEFMCQSMSQCKGRVKE
jgi:proteasome lid subunit RPN8/RPN11